MPFLLEAGKNHEQLNSVWTVTYKSLQRYFTQMLPFEITQHKRERAFTEQIKIWAMIDAGTMSIISHQCFRVKSAIIKLFGLHLFFSFMKQQLKVKLTKNGTKVTTAPDNCYNCCNSVTGAAMKTHTASCEDPMDYAKLNAWKINTVMGFVHLVIVEYSLTLSMISFMLTKRLKLVALK